MERFCVDIQDKTVYPILIKNNGNSYLTLYYHTEYSDSVLHSDKKQILYFKSAEDMEAFCKNNDLQIEEEIVEQEEILMEEEDILEAMDAPIQTASLDEPVGEEDGAVLGELIPYPDTETSDDRILLQENLQMLTAEERKLITLRYFMGKTQQETGQYLHTSQVQVSRKEKKILEKLKKQMTS